MPKVASDVKIAAHSAPRQQTRQPEQADSNPFAALLDNVAAEKPAAKPDRAAPAKESRKSEPSDPRAPQGDTAPAKDVASKDQPSAPTGEEPAAPTEAKAETEATEPAPATDAAEADLAAIIDATLVTPVPQPVQAAPIVAAPELAPVEITADTAEAIPAIAAAAAAIPPKPAAAPATASTDDASESQDATVASPAGDQAAAKGEGEVLAAKQPQHANGKQSDQQIANPQADAANTGAAKSGKAEHAADLEHTLKVAQPSANAQDNAPTFTLSTLHAHAAAQAAVTQPTAQVANAVPVSGIAFEIAAQAKAGGTRFEIRLDPPELGRIDVRLEVDKNGQVTSHLRVDRVETLDMLRRDSANLERALQDAGLKTSDNALNFSLRDQSQQQQAREQNTQSSQQYIATDDSMSAIGGTQVSAWASRLGGIDIRV